jgi:hypothetical protein
MTIMSLSQFKKQTSKTFSLRNGAIGAIDIALKKYWGTADREHLKKLKAAVDAFTDEKNTKYDGKGGYKNSARDKKDGISNLAEQIIEEMRGKPLATASQISSALSGLKSVPISNSSGQSFVVGANNTRKAGWAYSPFDPVEFSWTVELTTNLQGPLSSAMTARFTEALRRTKMALLLAHEVLIDISGLSTFPTVPTMEQQIYLDYFGPFDKARISKLKRNYTVLKLAVEKGPRIVDLRDTDFGLNCYAACFRADLGTKDTVTGQVSVLNAITVFLGRAFFAPSAMNYSGSTDATVGTLIHEFAHGAINAVDVPPVNAQGSWTHPRKSDNPADDDFGNSTDNQIQASTIPLDKLLATHKPNYAVVNADNYGQFAAALLTSRGG